jgi:RNA-directed DNA polymerase
MTNTPITLQDLRKRIYIKAKAEPAWRFWGLYVHVCKLETLQEAYAMAKSNNGAPGIDGVTFAAIEQSGVEGFLEQIRSELVEFRYLPLPPQRRRPVAGDPGWRRERRRYRRQTARCVCFQFRRFATAWFREH